MRPINLIKGAKQMKAVVMHEYGGPDVLKYEDVPDPVPGKGEVLIRMAAASINPVDLWQRAGTTKASLRVEVPAIIGWDLSGTGMSRSCVTLLSSPGWRLFLTRPPFMRSSRPINFGL